MKNIQYSIFGIVMLVAIAFGWTGCQDPDFTEQTNYEVLIGEYFEEHPDTFSMFTEILERSKTIAFLKAYGNYTCFAPTNEAVTAYLTEKGLSSVSQVSESDLAQLVRFCVINDTVSSEMFVDGRMEYASLQGQYLTTGTYFENGQTVIRVNKNFPILQKDIRVTNGIIHSMKKLLVPESRTVADYIKENADYSIFWNAMQETGFDEILNHAPSADSDTTWYTVLAVPDSVFHAVEIPDFNALKAKYGSSVDESGHDSLYYYMAYHVLENQYRFVSDMITNKVVNTMSPSEVLTVKTTGTTVLINDDTFAGVHEQGFVLNRTASDITVSNGVLHVMNENFAIKKRYPFAVYWDVTRLNEILKIPGVYGKSSVALYNGELEDITWSTSAKSAISYLYGGGNANGYTVYNDIFEIYLRKSLIDTIWFKTPTLVKGNYKIWVCTRNVSSTKLPKFSVYFNGVATGRVIDCSKYPTGFKSDGELNLLGYKIHSYKPTDFYTTDTASIQTNIKTGIERNWRNAGANQWGYVIGQLAGTVTVEETGSQTLMFIPVSAYQAMWLDQIQFIPVDEDQNWPRINVNDGSYVYKEDLLMGNFPVPK